MSTQPEALRLADELEDDLADYGGQSLPRISQDIADNAAAELRRLHAENEVMRNVANRGGHIAVAMSRIDRLEAQRDALLEALKGMLHRDERNTCRHEETHRGGALWEICDSCGAMWADDEGGKPEWEDPREWTQARTAIKAVEETK